MLSVISVTKGRHELTKDCFKSIWNNCSNPENIEHLVVYDGNDSETALLMNEYYNFCILNKYNFKYFIKNFNTEESYKYRNMHRDYWNPLSRLASGDVIFGLCNDTIIETKNYDAIIESSVIEHKKKYGHGFFQIRVDDDWPKEDKLKVNGFNYCSWIILTRECLEIFNGIAPSEISSQGADLLVSRVFDSTDIKSVIDLSDIVKTKQISVQKGNYNMDDPVQTERPVSDQDRKEWPIFSDILFNKNYYHHKLNNRILQSVLLGKK